MAFPGADDLMDAVLTRVLRLAQEPFRIREAMARLTGPSHSLFCAVSDVPVQPGRYHWRDGLAVLERGRFLFMTEPGGPDRSTFEVQGVIETRSVRRRADNGPGPRRQRVAKLRTANGFVYWAAHEKLLAEGEAILLGRPRSIA